MSRAEDGKTAVEMGWRWDSTLYRGSAVHYARGRVAYPSELVTLLTDELGLDGRQRLLDVGCGPGSLALALAPYVGEVVGVDADADMIAVAARAASEQQVHNARWRCLRAEELPADLAGADVVTFAQSLHWMDRLPVLSATRALLEPGGVVVHVHATTHRGDASSQTAGDEGHTAPPWEAIMALVRKYLGATPRAGASPLPTTAGGGESRVFRAAAFTGPRRLEVPGWVVRRSEEEILSAVHSLSGATPTLFGGDLAAFDAELISLLARTSVEGSFVERMRGIAVDVWTPAAG